MPDYFKKNSINRIIDANINRAKEGLRVCEEITRFLLDDRKFTAEFKRIRHEIDGIVRKLPLSVSALLNQRRSASDVGEKIYANELKRKNVGDIFFANIQRAKESIRVLEEFTKLLSINSAVRFKTIRYDIYRIERMVARKFSASRTRR